MIHPTGFRADQKGGVDRGRLLLVGGALLIAGTLAYDLFGNRVAERFTAEDPGVDAFAAQLEMATGDVASR